MAEQTRPRLCRLAVVGAVSAPLTVAAGLVMAFIRGVELGLGNPRPEPSALEIGAWVLLSSAALGTTFLGWVAVLRIRGSGGHLRGMGLALAEGLVFPLLALDAVVTSTCNVAIAVALSCESRGFFGALSHPALPRDR